MATMTAADGNVRTAKNYYEAMNEKDLDQVGRLLHPEVEMIAPLVNVNGRSAVLDAANRFQAAVNGITVRSSFGSDDQAALVYDADFGPPIGICRTAVLMSFKDFLIARIELFYDPRPFDKYFGDGDPAPQQ